MSTSPCACGKPEPHDVEFRTYNVAGFGKRHRGPFRVAVTKHAPGCTCAR